MTLYLFLRTIYLHIGYHLPSLSHTSRTYYPVVAGASCLRPSLLLSRDHSAYTKNLQSSPDADHFLMPRWGEPAALSLDDVFTI